MRVWIIANNPGYWFLHCHIEPHQMEGMAVIINEVESEQNCPPSELIHKCGDFEWDVSSFDKAVQSIAPCSSTTSGFEIAVYVLVPALVLVLEVCVIMIYLVCKKCIKERKTNTEMQAETGEVTLKTNTETIETMPNVTSDSKKNQKSKQSKKKKSKKKKTETQDSTSNPSYEDNYSEASEIMQDSTSESKHAIKSKRSKKKKSKQKRINKDDFIVHFS